MNKIFKNKIIALLCIGSLFLTGCKKKQKIENNDQVISEKAQVETFEENENSLNRESIFADEEDDSEDLEIYEKSENKNIAKVYDNNEVNEKQRKVGTLYFNFNVRNKLRDDQNSEFKRIKEEISEIVAENKNAKFLIIGHACNSEGTEEYNMQLSDDRATTVKKMIIKNNGIDKQSISSCGRGISELIVFGNKKEQALNRRVEIFILENN